MTIEKGLLVPRAGQRRRGVSSEAEAQVFAETLGRKRTRAAFPDLFVKAVGRMRKRIIDKHDSDTSEGQFLRSIREIRIRALPDWKSPNIEVEFLFIFDLAMHIPPDADVRVSQLVSRVQKGEWIVDVHSMDVLQA